MKRTTRANRRIAVSFLVGTILAGGCGDGTDESTQEDAAQTTVPLIATPSRSSSAMRVTFEISPEAVWSDGTPITIDDFRCTVDSAVNTTGSVLPRGYELINGVEPGETEHSVVVSFSELFAPYKTLFSPIVPAHTVEDCNDVSGDWQQGVPVSGAAFMLGEWDEDSLTLLANDNYWGEKAKAAEIEFVPHSDDEGVAELLSGDVDFISPQPAAGLDDALADESISYVSKPSTSIEMLLFQQGEERGGPLSDPTFRQAFSLSIDRELLLQDVYKQIADGFELATCGMWIRGGDEWCGANQFVDTFDPERAADLLTAQGWERDDNGFWTRNGDVPEIEWLINTPNPRRERAQELLIPALAAHGFLVTAVTDTAANVFQTRLPTGDFDVGMFFIDFEADPGRGQLLACDQIPNAESDFQGRNVAFWCNPQATAVLAEADTTLDLDRRRTLTHRIGQYLVDDAVLLPLVEVPETAAWRTDRITGDEPAAELGNFLRFAASLHNWEPANGDRIVIGATQWPRCLNPVTECNSSTWAAVMGIRPILPAAWKTTAVGTYTFTELLTAEPTLELE